MKKISILLFLSVFIYANESGGVKHYDILWRSINFFAFFAILFFLVKKPAKEWYFDRKNSITNRINSVNEKLKQAQKDKEDSISNLDNAKIQASKIIDGANAQAKKIELDNDELIKKEIASMQLNYKNLQELQSKNLTTEVTKKLIDDIFADKKIDENKIVDIILKKVI